MVRQCYPFDSFRLWLESDVSGHEDEVARWAAKRLPSPFASWFGKDGRTYVDFRPAQNNSADDDIVNHFKDTGYEILDYAKGLVKDKYGRAVRIGAAG